MLSTNEFAQLRAFIAVAETLHFSRAAERLGVSASALSQMIRALEERTGSRLLNRTTRRVSLTDTGAALLDRARPASVELDAAMQQARRAQAGPVGQVRIHCFRRAAALFVAPLLPAFNARYPHVVLDVTSDDAVEDVVAGRYDAAIRIGEVIDQDMVAVRLGPDMRQVVVGAPRYLEEHGEPSTPHDLRQHRCIQWRWPGRETPEPWEFWDGGRWFGVAVAGPLVVNDRDLETSAAVAGIGLACTVAERVSGLVSSGALRPVLQSWAGAFPGYFLCYPRQRHMAPALRAFIDHCVEVFAGQNRRVGSAPPAIARRSALRS